VTIHYHMTPITPVARLKRLAGRHFGVSFEEPKQVRYVHEIGQTVMLDNGAFTAWRQGRPIKDWTPFYEWTDKWLDHPTTWAIIPDVIAGTLSEQERLIEQWPHGDRGAPVWHTNEPLEHLLALCERWPIVCFGSTDDFGKLGSDPWRARIEEAFDALERVFKRVPRIHMMRGMGQCGDRWPFYSVDSSSVGQNAHRKHAPLFEPLGMACGADEYAGRFDAVQCPPRLIRPEREQAA
jgi:hypothetical protein